MALRSEIKCSKCLLNVNIGHYLGGVKADVWKDHKLSHTAPGVYDLCHERTCLRGVRSGPTQTMLYNHRRLFEISDLGIKRDNVLFM